jgi:hypothetical protein
MNKNVYIPSLEASDIWEHMYREKELKINYHGMIPYSLELIKLQSLKDKGFITQNVKENTKIISNALINVKFNRKVRSGEEIIKKLNKKIKSAYESKEEYKRKLETFKEQIQSEIDNDKWNGLSNEKLREELYLNGFTITDDKGNQTVYKVYKRSSSKSRTGQCLFISESLYSEMIDWSRMYLPCKKNEKIDLASLLAYESLVLSSLEDTIKINPRNIMIVDDVESKFTKLANVVKKGEDGHLDSLAEETEIVNSLFDGESLLDSKYFENGQSMKLLRNHMFKSAAFNTNIQTFLKDYWNKNIKPKGIAYEEWELLDMFDCPILAKDVELIITPSSLKVLKFSDVLGGKKQMWDYWRELVAVEGSLFGVCKHESESKRGTDEHGNILQQTSYQMLNSMPLSEVDIEELTIFEREYINKLKNDDGTFIEHIEKEANSINCNMMFVDLYRRNKNIVHTKIFRDFRKAVIKKHVIHTKKGKLRLHGDYCVMLGNPLEFLYHAVGDFDINNPKLALKENEVYTTLFDFDKEYVGFRNPHTSPSNVLIVKNSYNKDIDTYFNLTKNIVVVNTVNFELPDILSGSDFDSDTMALFNSERLLQIAKDCYKKYHVCINRVQGDKVTYNLNLKHMSVIDNRLSKSQRYIGQVVNLGQLCMSRYWDLISKNENGVYNDTIEKLMKSVSVMTILSGIAIDMAKKFYEIEMKEEIEHVEKKLKLKTKTIINTKGEEREIPCKPLFFQYVSQNENIKNKIIAYNCPMDFLNEQMSKLPNAKHRENVDLTDLLDGEGVSIRKGNRKQEKKIITYVEEQVDKINYINATIRDQDEKNRAIDDVIKYYEFYISKLKVKPDTMYAILVHIEKNKLGKVATRLMNVLYITQKDVFINAFKRI